MLGRLKDILFVEAIKEGMSSSKGNFQLIPQEQSLLYC